MFLGEGITELMFHNPNLKILSALLKRRLWKLAGLLTMILCPTVLMAQTGNTQDSEFVRSGEEVVELLICAKLSSHAFLLPAADTPQGGSATFLIQAMPRLEKIKEDIRLERVTRDEVRALPSELALFISLMSGKGRETSSHFELGTWAGYAMAGLDIPATKAPDPLTIGALFDATKRSARFEYDKRDCQKWIDQDQ